MSEFTIIKDIEDLNRFKNDNGIIEIITRNKNKKFKDFFKIAIDKHPESKEKIDEAINLLNKNNNILNNNTKLLNTITSLNILNSVLGGLNLFATCAGFAIMNQKLKMISNEVCRIVNVINQTNNIQTVFEYNKVLSEHSNMLDCRKKGEAYSEEQLRELVANEYNVLDMLIQSFSSNTIGDDNRNNMVFTILSLASMLSISIQYFDEIYYFKYKEKTTGENRWHMDHNKWLSIFDQLSSSEFIKQIQDHGFVDLELSTKETDCYYISFIDQILSLKQSVLDNQSLISRIDDKELFESLNKDINSAEIAEIERILNQSGLETNAFQVDLQAVFA